jgi:hypothetical protein
MKYLLGLVALIVGCVTDAEFKQKAAPVSTAIKVAEESGATQSPNSAYYLRLAKEEYDQARELLVRKKKSEATSLLLRAEADAKLATALAREEKDKIESATARGRIQQLRKDHELPGNNIFEDVGSAQ